MKNNIQEMAEKIGRITAEKNIAYGSAFAESGKILEILFPNGVKPEQYQDLLLVTRILDKLFRIANDRDALNEDPYMDISGYGLLGAVSVGSKQQKKAENIKEQEESRQMNLPLELDAFPTIDLDKIGRLLDWATQEKKINNNFKSFRSLKCITIQSSFISAAMAALLLQHIGY